MYLNYKWSDLNKVVNTKIRDDIGSDQLPLILKLNLGAMKDKNMYNPHWIYQKIQTWNIWKNIKTEGSEH